MNDKKTWWEDPLKEAEAAGFTHETPSNDVPLERGGGLHLTRGNTYIWQFIKSGVGVFWQVAELIDGRFCNHRPQESIQEALKAADAIPER